MPCFMLRSTCFRLYAMFSYVLCLFCSRLMLGLHAHLLVWRCWICLAWIYVFVCFSPCFMLRSTSVHAYMLGFMFFHVYVPSFDVFIHVLPCLWLDVSPDFHHGNLVFSSNAIGKHRLGPHLSKAKLQSPHVCKALKANAKIMFLLPISKN